MKCPAYIVVALTLSFAVCAGGQELGNQLIDFPELEIGCGESFGNAAGINAPGIAEESANASGARVANLPPNPLQWRRQGRQVSTALPPGFVTPIQQQALVQRQNWLSRIPATRLVKIGQPPAALSEEAPLAEDANPYESPSTPTDQPAVEIPIRTSLSTALPDWFILRQTVESPASATGHSRGEAPESVVPAPTPRPAIRSPAPSGGSRRALRYLTRGRGRCG